MEWYLEWFLEVGCPIGSEERMEKCWIMDVLIDNNFGGVVLKEKGGKLNKNEENDLYNVVNLFWANFLVKIPKFFK